MKKKWLSLGLVLVSAASLSLPAYAKEEVGPTRENTLTIAVPFLVVSKFDPLATPLTDHKVLEGLLYDSLVGHTVDGKLSTETGLAYKWEMSPDGKTWTFHLRKGIKFHNGDELTAEDVKFHLQRIFDPTSVSTGAPALRDLIDSIEATDRYTVVVHCKNSAIFLNYMLSETVGTEGMICPKNYFKEKGVDYYATHPIGTGPFKLKEFVPGVHVLFEAAFDEHFALGKPKYKYVKFLIIPEQAARIGMLARREADIAILTRDKLKEVKAAGIRTARDPNSFTFVLCITTQWDPQYPVYDKRVREAISLAIDKKALLEGIWGGLGKTTGHVVGVPGSLGYKPIEAQPYNPDRARKLLAEAGYPNGFKIKLHAAPLVTEVFPTFEVLVDYLARVGIKAELVMYPDWATFRPLRAEGGKALKGGIYPNTMGAKFYTLSTIRWNYYSGAGSIKNPVLDKMIDRAITTIDPKEAAELV